jgi:hypothetical protein
MTLQYATRTASRTYSQADIEKSRAAFDELCRLLNLTPSRRGEVDYECPGCHHAVVKGKTHFSFSAKGGKCFSCNWHGGIYNVAKAIGMTIRDRASVAQILDTPKRDTYVRGWQKSPETYPERFCDHACSCCSARASTAKPVAKAISEQCRVGPPRSGWVRALRLR